MKTKKFSFLQLVLLAVIALLAACVLPLQAEVGSNSFGITNTIKLGTLTSAANVGSSVLVDNMERANLEFRFGSTANETSTIILTFARSKDGSVWETSPQFTMTAAANGGTPVVKWADLPATTLGSAYAIKCVSIVSTNTSDLTNCSLSVVKKTLKAAP